MVLLVFLLSSKKSYPTYLVMAFFPLCVTVASGAFTRGWRLLWIVFVVGRLRDSHCFVLLCNSRGTRDPQSVCACRALPAGSG